MSRIDEAMPRYQLREVDHIAVAADPAQAWERVRAVNMFDLPVVHALFALRVLPDKVRALFRRTPSPKPLAATLDDIVAPGTGFMKLFEEPGREFVVGAVGRFWKLNIPYAPATPDTFKDFDEPGYGKLAWNLKVEPREGRGAWITVDLRVGATDPRSWRQFRRYWFQIGRFSRFMRRRLLAKLARELGKLPTERTWELPGDGLLPNARLLRTHRRDIEAPPAKVWPWLVQIGARRGGWYSVDLLDNRGRRSADSILPEHQNVQVGDIIPGLPGSGAESGFAVLEVDREQALVLGSPSLLPADFDFERVRWPFDMTWAFVLEPIGSDATRLLARVRADFAPTWQMRIYKPIITLVHELMQRTQLKNLKARVENLLPA